MKYQKNIIKDILNYLISNQNTLILLDNKK